MRRLAAILVPLALGGCDREAKQYRPDPPFATDAGRYAQEYEGNAYAMSEGKRLFAVFNCVGCHSHGGGGMGPPLMDSAWIYGFEPANIYATIANGRPNGMPAFEHRITPQQMWELVAYVRSMSGQGGKAARTNRSDEMEVRAAESQTKTEKPVLVTPPPTVRPPAEEGHP